VTSEFPVIETARLILREIVVEDAPALLAIHSDVEHMRFFGVAPLADLASAQSLVDAFAKLRQLPNPTARWAITLKQNAQKISQVPSEGNEQNYEFALMGSCGFFAWNRDWRRAMLGYELARAVQGHGYMHEALTALLAWGFAQMGLNRVDALIHPHNTSSMKLAEKIGFEREGLLREVGYWSGQHHDMVQLSLLRRDWETAASRQC
jgi:[ribosomal protein S5]-alanine N-acetyltransferase